jgi:hydrogenase maturation protein HypF
LDPDGKPVEDGPALDLARTLLVEGKILAVKGVGGFHLAVDATQPEAVERLRTFKDRGGKPFAVMAASPDLIRSFAQVSDGEMEALQSPARPVVLLRKRTDPGLPLADAVAPANPLLGVMMPYTALHLLLLQEPLSVLVMTSANRKNEPMVRDTGEALGALSGVADGFLTHDLVIHARCDDSVGRWIHGRFRVFRRSRGFAPLPLALDDGGPSILATGGLMKNTVCLSKDGRAFLSAHVGDLETPSGLGALLDTACHMDRLFQVAPNMLVHDSHPDAPTAGLNCQYPRASVMTVQHHHAHIVSCMVEHKFNDPVIGFAFDGTGYGDDGTLWGGEVLVSTRVDYRRAAHLVPVPMPGASAAVEEPWRMGLSFLYRAFGPSMWDLDVPLIKHSAAVFDPDTAQVLIAMMEKGVNAPLTSSMGRLFDAVAAILGLCYENTFDAQAAMALEFCAIDEPENVNGYTVAMIQEKDGVLVVDSAPLIRAVVSDLVSGVPQRQISARFHQTLIDQFTAIGVRLAEQTGIPVAALSGGVFQNARMLSGLTRSLESQGFTVLTQAQIPSGDGGLALGQAGIAAARKGA